MNEQSVSMLASLVNDDESRDAALFSLEQIGSPAIAAVPVVETLMKSGAHDVRLDAAVAWLMIDIKSKAAAAVLTDALGSEKYANPVFQARAASALMVAGIEMDRARDILLREARIGNTYAFEALGTLHVPSSLSTPPLISALKHDSPIVRIIAAETLGRIVPPLEETIPALAGACRDSNPYIRIVSRRSLAQLKRREPN